MDVLLESFVFAYMGLQCRFVFADLAATGVEWGAFVAIAATLLFVVLAVRPLWIFLTYGNDRLFHRWRLRLANRPAVARRLAARAARQRAAGRPERTPEEPLSWKYAAVLSWSVGHARGGDARGRRRCAGAGPGGLSFPQRDLIQALAFVIALGTLLIQTPTLPLLIRRLHISAPEEQRREAEGIRRAHEISREATHQAARKVLESPPEGADPGVLAQYADKLAAAAAERRKADDEDDAVDSAVMSDSARATIRVVRQELLAAQRRALVRGPGQLGAGRRRGPPPTGAARPRGGRGRQRLALTISAPARFHRCRPRGESRRSAGSRIFPALVRIRCYWRPHARTAAVG